MERSYNLFTDGITTDLHPLTILKTLMTDALNATFRTYNGNEMLLQNDMGNTLILDSTTGNIMGLRDKFVPVGMKERGGILYIASFNPFTLEGQLGTVPSPVINYNYLNAATQTLNTPLTGLSGNLNNMYISGGKFLINSVQLSTNRFLVGDQFIVSLDFGDIPKIQRTPIIDPILLYTTNITKTPASKSTINFKFISGLEYRGEDTLEVISDYGMFNLLLEAKVEKSNQTLPLYKVMNKVQYYYKEENLFPEKHPTANEDKYWFAALSSGESLDNELCQADGCYNSYPNILPGYLYIKIRPELPHGFSHLKNTSTGVFSPNVYIITH